MPSKTYDIITVDWNPDQTKLWRRYVEKTCPTANIITIPDNKPVPWNWSSGKIDCFKYDFPHPDRVMYMDTDTIVTTDLEPVFDMMGDAQFAASSSIPAKHLRLKYDPRLARALLMDKKPIHYSTGFTAHKDIVLQELYEGWYRMSHFPLMRPYRRHMLFEEIAFSYFVAHKHYKTWEMPPSVHGNILRGCQFTGTPMVIHYHRPARLINAGLGEYLK